jgi:KDO2-lipid IV(A) lauroyltransferase
LALSNRPVTALIRRWSSPDINALFVRQREEWGVEVIHSGGGGDEPAEAASGARAVLRALQRNRAAAILADRPGTGPVVTVNFFDREASLPLGPWRLAERSGAPLLPTFVHRQAPRRYVLTVGAPLPEPPAAAALDERILFRAQAWTAVWEERLRADPTQWAAFAPLRSAAEPAGSPYRSSLQQTAMAGGGA